MQHIYISCLRTHDTHTQHINHIKRQHKLDSNIKKQWVHSSHLQLPTVAQEYDSDDDWNNDLIDDCTGDGGGIVLKRITHHS